MKLNANSPVQGGAATIGTGYIPNTSANVSVDNAGTDLNISASEANLSAKYKYPHVSQDTVPEDLVAKAGSSI